MIAPDEMPPERTRDLRSLLTTYAVRLRLARALVGIGRGKLAARADLPTDVIDALERGVRHPFAREARAIADALQIPIDFFRASGVSTEVLLKVFSGETDAKVRAALSKDASDGSDR